MCPVALGRLIEHMSHSLNFDPIQMQIWEMTKGETETGTQFYVGRSTMGLLDYQRRISTTRFRAAFSGLCSPFDLIQMQIWEMTNRETETRTQFYVGRSTMGTKDSQRRNWIIIHVFKLRSFGWIIGCLLHKMGLLGVNLPIQIQIGRMTKGVLHWNVKQWLLQGKLFYISSITLLSSQHFYVCPIFYPIRRCSACRGCLKSSNKQNYPLKYTSRPPEKWV